MYTGCFPVLQRSFLRCMQCSWLNLFRKNRGYIWEKGVTFVKIRTSAEWKSKNRKSTVPSLSEKCPAGHWLQSSAPSPEKSPAEQSSQFVEPAFPAALPAAHSVQLVDPVDHFKYLKQKRYTFTIGKYRHVVNRFIAMKREDFYLQLHCMIL